MEFVVDQMHCVSVKIINHSVHVKKASMVVPVTSVLAVDRKTTVQRTLIVQMIKFAVSMQQV